MFVNHSPGGLRSYVPPRPLLRKERVIHRLTEHPQPCVSAKFERMPFWQLLVGRLDSVRDGVFAIGQVKGTDLESADLEPVQSVWPKPLERRPKIFSIALIRRQDNQMPCIISGQNRLGRPLC
jgi:hypothetical protein